MKSLAAVGFAVVVSLIGALTVATLPATADTAAPSTPSTASYAEESFTGPKNLTNSGHFLGPDGEVWIPTVDGFTELSHSGVFTERALNLPDYIPFNAITASDSSVWFVLPSSSAMIADHLSASNELTPYSVPIPVGDRAQTIGALQSDGHGGMWMQMALKSNVLSFELVHVASLGAVTVYALPFRAVQFSVATDGSAWATGYTPSPDVIDFATHATLDGAATTFDLPDLGSDLFLYFQQTADGDAHFFNQSEEITIDVAGVVSAQQIGELFGLATQSPTSDWEIFSNSVGLDSDPSFSVSLPAGYSFDAYNSLEGAQSSWVDANGDLWVIAGSADGGAIFEFTTSGQVIEKASLGFIAGPGTFYPGPNDDAWLVSPYDLDYSVLHIASDGSKSQVFLSDRGNPIVDGSDGFWTFTGTNQANLLVPTATTRVEAADRYAEAVAISQQEYPNSAPTVYLASGENFPDALSASPIAAKNGGPLLLTESDVLPPEVATELQRLNPSRVVIAGGANSVSPAVAGAVETALPGATVTREAGADRFATSRTLALSAFSTSSTVWVATGDNFPDALGADAAAGSARQPVLLVNGNATSLDAASLAALRTLQPTTVNVVGGTEAVSAGIMTQLQADFTIVNRLQGSDRYATADAIDEASFPQASIGFIASGDNFPDALTGSVWAADTHAPLYLIPADCVPAQDSNDIGHLSSASVTILGGPAAVSPNVDDLTLCDSND